jgi:hypothetical protein
MLGADFGPIGKGLSDRLLVFENWGIIILSFLRFLPVNFDNSRFYLMMIILLFVW